MARKKRRKQNKLAAYVLTTLILLVMFVGAVMILGNYHFNPSYEQSNVSAQHKKFINKILPKSVEMQRKYKILTSITIAQAILESDWGQSRLAAKYNNLFGVKAGPGQKSVTLDTTEYTSGSPVMVHGKFRVYDNWDESIEAHAFLLAHGTDWNPMQYKEVVDADNYVDSAKALSTDGYATDPAYAEKIIKIIKKYHLNQYDKQ
ncbi:glycoside hydrolase family 73 protein [Fructilactobacillus fructivorans]|uniref:glycoside hydrolase family 73 protein n=1 Tax=Fructilactobacillus fructivorans TaxID=1614 RepID=UPI000714F0CD|nr:glycoside hydrolase family 73 protein [Fructilactobacillus fructivorans]KRN40324.1 N-acetylmuramidase [Fructilactobacillus fructivorans]